MRRSAALAPLLAAALASGCGGASSHATAGSTAPSPTTAAASPRPLPQSEQLVLTQADSGHGYWTVQDKTSPMSLAETAQGDPAHIKSIEKRAFANGYRAVYGAPGAAVVSTASVFRSSAAARTIVADWAHRGLGSLPHAVVQPIPGDGPGTGAVMVRASANANGQEIPTWAIAWRHGSVIAGTVVLGPHAGASRLLALARLQDQRIALALAG